MTAVSPPMRDVVGRLTRRTLSHPRRRESPGRVWWAAAATAVLAGIALRFVCRSPLWLDEAQTVAIAKRPLSELPAALRHDGAPPLYYALLHLWVRVVGDGATQVRALSALIGVLALPVAWRVAHRLGGRPAAATAVLLLACSPFAIFFASEARMYELVILLTLLGVLALLRVVDQPSLFTAAAVSAATAALLLTHYWTAFLVMAAVIVVLAGAARHRIRRRTAAVTVGAIGVGCAGFLAWWPVLQFQIAHTGTPWAAPPTASTLARLFADWTTPAQTVVFDGVPRLSYVAALVLATTLFVMLVMSVVPARWLRPRGDSVTAGRALVAGAAIALALAVAASRVIGGGYEPRYTGSMFAIVMVAAAVGAGRLPVAVRVALVGGVCALGLTSTAVTAAGSGGKTQAGVIADAITRSAAPGDVVAYCPDQLAPAVNRLLPSTLTQLAFPEGRSVSTVDWVDYARRNAQASPARFAAQVDAAAGRHTIWLVDVPHGYATFKNDCRAVQNRLSAGRARVVVERARPHSYYEFANLVALSPEPPR